MGKSTNRTLNELLVKLFNNVMDTEERAVITKEFEDITNNDMHIIEAIGIEEPRRMSDIAKRLDVTMGTLTTNMNSLEDKGYIVRERSKTDKRVVLVVLTPKGKKAFYHHRDFHKNMIKNQRWDYCLYRPKAHLCFELSISLHSIRKTLLHMPMSFPANLLASSPQTEYSY